MINIGEVLSSRYKIMAVIGKGGMGQVYLAEDLKTGEKLAVKEAIVSRSDRESLINEISIQKKINHPAVPKIHDIIDTDDTYIIVMDYCRGTGLDKILRPAEGQEPVVIEEARARKWALQLSNILSCLHSQNPPVVFRDLKPSNIIIDPEDNLMLIDFGIAARFTEEDRYTNDIMALTKGYAAPEQYDNQYSLDFRTDIYAFGATFHYVLTGKNPNRPPYQFDPVRNLNPAVSEGMEKVIMRCLNPNPDERYPDAVALEKDLRSIEGLTKSIKKKKKKNAAGAVIAVAVFVAALLAGFIMIRAKSEKKYAEYIELVEQAEELVSHRDLDGAEALLDEAYALEPDEPDAYILRAEILYAAEDYEGCLEYVRNSILDSFPDVMENRSFLRLMVKLYDQLGDTEMVDYYNSRLE